MRATRRTYRSCRRIGKGTRQGSRMQEWHSNQISGERQHPATGLRLYGILSRKIRTPHNFAQTSTLTRSNTRRATRMMCKIFFFPCAAPLACYERRVPRSRSVLPQEGPVSEEGKEEGAARPRGSLQAGFPEGPSTESDTTCHLSRRSSEASPQREGPP